MSLANFFQKTSLAASSVLRGFDTTVLTREIEAQRVAIVFDRAALSSEGRITLEMATNLLARLYPSLSLVGVGHLHSKAAAELEGLARAINPDILVDERATDVTISVIV